MVLNSSCHRKCEEKSHAKTINLWWFLNWISSRRSFVLWCCPVIEKLAGINVCGCGERAMRKMGFISNVRTIKRTHVRIYEKDLFRDARDFWPSTHSHTHEWILNQIRIIDPVFPVNGIQSSSWFSTSSSFSFKSSSSFSSHLYMYSVSVKMGKRSE